MLIIISLVSGSKAWQYAQQNKISLEVAKQDLATISEAANKASEATATLNSLPIIGSPAEPTEHAISSAVLLLNHAATVNGVTIVGITAMGGSAGNVSAADISSTFQMTGEKAHKSRITVKLSYVDFEGLKSFLKELSMRPIIIKNIKIYKDVIDTELEFISVDA